MKTFHFNFTVLLFFISCSAFAQVQLDKQLQFTGTGNNARITGIDSVGASSDATSVKALQSGSFIYADASGSGNNFSINLSPPIAAYQKGMFFNFISNQNITGPATLNVNSMSAKTIKKNINQNTGQCDIQSGQMVTVVYDGTNFQMTSVSVPLAPTTANAGPNQVVAGTSTTLAANTPTIGTGLWTIISGSGGSLSNSASPASTFTGLAGNTYILNWTISSCGLYSSSADTITFQFAPTALSGLEVWYDANDASTFTYSSGSSVSVWADKSGHGFNASNSNTSEQPVLVSNDINGRPAVRFTGSANDYLANAVFTMNIANRSVFIVIEENDANISQSRWLSLMGSGNDYDSDNGYELGNTTAARIEICNDYTVGYLIYANDGGSGNYDAPLNIYADIASGGVGSAYVGGVLGGSSSNTNATTSAGGLAIGGGYYAGFTPGRLDGDYAELIIYNRMLTNTERDEVGAYLSAKWGISFTP